MEIRLAFHRGRQGAEAKPISVVLSAKRERLAAAALKIYTATSCTRCFMVQAGERGGLSAAHPRQGVADTVARKSGVGEAGRTRRGAEWGETLPDRLTQRGRGRG